MKSLQLLICLAFLSVAATTHADTINLSWNPNTEADLAGYAVSYGTQPGVYVSSFDSGKNTSQAVSNLANGTRYYFVVKAYNTSGTYSLASVEVSGVAADPVPTLPPTVPAGPLPASGSAAVSPAVVLNWTASAYAASYDVAFGKTNPPAVVSSSQTATTYQPAALTAGTTYYWQIVAKNAKGSTSGPVWSFTTAVAGTVVPVAEYSFNEGTGTTTIDASGSGRTGAVSNATWSTAGKNGGALSFNGSTSRVTVADAAALR
ncbi:MAG: fibronectin type III domain-containing protein, partial [Acidobacteriota bacterium]